MGFWSSALDIINKGYEKYTEIQGKVYDEYDKKMDNYDRYYRSFQDYSKETLVKIAKDTTKPREMRKAAHDLYEEKYGEW